MPYTTNQLITGAYYTAGVVSREFETVSGGQISDGLGWLNDILAEKRVDNGMVPYETKYSFNALPGVETYWIPNLVQIDTFVFYLDKVRYPMQYTKRNQYYGAPRVENIKTLPHQWYFERKVGGGNLHIYFLPDQNYPMEVHGTFGIPPVVLNQDLWNYNSFFDLGVPTFFGPDFGTLNQGQLVVTVPIQSGNVVVDLMGTYTSIGSLVNYINTGIIPGVLAKVNVNDFILYSATEPPTPFYVQTNGFPANGTNLIGNVYVATTDNLNATYFPGNNGVGATLTSLDFSALLVDGLTPPTESLVLVKDETANEQNGVYQLTSIGIPWVLTRTANYNQPIQINEGNLFTVLNGGTNGGSTFVQTSDVNFVGDSPIIFVSFTDLTFSNFSTIEQSAYEVVNPTGFDEFYTTYLRYALADRICAEYHYDTPANVIRQLGKYESWIDKKSKLIDLQLKKQSTLGRRMGYNWSFINLGKGWTVGD